MLRIELLSRGHDRQGFRCGERDLDDYLKRTARQHNDKGISRTFVLVDSEEPSDILGFFTLASCEVVTDCPSVCNTIRWLGVSTNPAPRTPVDWRAAAITSSTLTPY